MLSTSEAAKLIGMTKQGLMKAIRAGRLSATKDVNGGYQIDPAELFRVYEPVKKEVISSEEVETTLPQNESEVRSLRREIELLEERIRDKQEVIDDLRARLDHSEDERAKLNAVLIAKEETGRIPWWRRLVG